jgi:hypothetical protein
MAEEKEHNPYKMAAESLLKEIDVDKLFDDIRAILDNLPEDASKYILKKLNDRYMIMDKRILNRSCFLGRGNTKYGGPF